MNRQGRGRVISREGERQDKRREKRSKVLEKGERERGAKKAGAD